MSRDLPREEFTEKTKRVVARRAGYQCSFPDCGLQTEGPTSQSERATSIGVAAHICAASPGGPRYESSQTPPQRGSAKNGIWLCQNHAKLVDGDPDRYDADTLRKLKREHELLVKRNFARSSHGKGPVEVIHLEGQSHVTVNGFDVHTTVPTQFINASDESKADLNNVRFIQVQPKKASQ